MPVEAYEGSAFAGRPFFLYEFIRNSGGTDFYWRYNSSDRNIRYMDVEWKAVPISHDGMRFNGEATSTDLTVTMPIAEKFCEQFRLNGATPSDTVWLRIRKVHAGDLIGEDDGIPTLEVDALVQWIGTINGINQTTEVEAQVRCSMLSASFRRAGLRYGWQKSCPHVLYAPNTCKVNRESFKVTGDVVSISGATVNVAEFSGKPDGWFDGGFIEFLIASGMTEHRMILSHVGANIIIMGLPVGIVVGNPITAFAGCDLTITTCVNKFNNLDNNGSFPHSPGRNPFDGRPIF